MFRLFGTQSHCRSITLKSGSKKKMNFLDINIKNINGRYEFDVHRKPALTNVQIKPHSYIPPDAIISIFKGFLARATKICSEKYLRAEIQYLTDTFCENRHDRKTLQKIINNFEKKHMVPTVILITTLKKNTQLPFPGYQKSDQTSKKKYKNLDLE